MGAKRPKNEACPHCGDARHGYKTVITLREDRFYDWSESDVDHGDTHVVRESQGECIQCKGPIKLPLRANRL